jgi:Zn-dependent protease with chaperone function
VSLPPNKDKRIFQTLFNNVENFDALTLACGAALMSLVDESANILEPLPYHVDLRDYLKSQEPELWNWFASAKAKADYTENLRLELLKSTYRLDAAGHPELHQGLEAAKARLQLDIPVMLYQAQNSPQLNAALYFIPGEGHIVFSGPMFTLLDAEEMKSVIGHELAHYLLWERDAGEFHIADRLIQTVAGDPRASGSHEQTARWNQLYTEIFADRGSLCVTGDPNPVVAGLVKIQTGLAQVSAASYLKQAEEIFANRNVATEGLSHPEAFIRARALSLWQEQRERAATHIRNMIEGATTLEGLDLVGQKRLTAATRRLLEYLLRPKWFQTPATLGHAKLFFAEFTPAIAGAPPLPEELKAGDASLREYICYVLLDFAKSDPDLDDMPLAAALEVSRQLEMDVQFEKLAAKELNLKVREVRRIKEQAQEMLAKAEADGA